MSIRPTTVSRKDCINAHNSTNPYGHVIIGDTVSATLYAKRLLNNGVTTPISIISEGVDRTNIEDLVDVNFAANNNLRILHYLKTEQIHLVPVGDNQNEDDDSAAQTERIIHYHVGAGPLGDFIAAYHIPRLGPWFTHSSNGYLEKFLNAYTVKSALTTQETIVANRLQQIWSIPLTNSLIVKQPSILNVHHEFLEQNGEEFSRELFLNQYHLVNQAGSANYITEATNLQFTQATGSTGLYDVTGNNISLQGVRPIWRTNPFTYLRLASKAGLNPSTLLVPTFYRAVLSIPLDNSGVSGPTGSTVAGPTGFVCFGTGTTGSICYVGLTGITGVNLSDLMGTEDLVTSHLAFSLHDIANPKHSGLAWLIQTYTTPEDLSVVHQEGKYADNLRTLLIIEALSTKNKRRATFNSAENELQVNYNDRLIEKGYLRQFATIVASIYNAYTGNLISVDSLLTEASVCVADSGPCHDANTLVDYALRESPMISILELVSHMYGSDIYPNPSKC